jgi:WD40 repeat protein
MQTVRLYDVYKNTLTARYNHKSAVLTGCWSDDYHCFSGGLDKTVKLFVLLPPNLDQVAPKNFGAQFFFDPFAAAFKCTGFSPFLVEISICDIISFVTGGKLILPTNFGSCALP